MQHCVALNKETKKARQSKKDRQNNDQIHRSLFLYMHSRGWGMHMDIKMGCNIVYSLTACILRSAPSRSWHGILRWSYSWGTRRVIESLPQLLRTTEWCPKNT
jgi:hypothetical protein